MMMGTMVVDTPYQIHSGLVLTNRLLHKNALTIIDDDILRFRNNIVHLLYSTCVWLIQL